MFFLGWSMYQSFFLVCIYIPGHIFVQSTLLLYDFFSIKKILARSVAQAHKSKFIS